MRMCLEAAGLRKVDKQVRGRSSPQSVWRSFRRLLIGEECMRIWCLLLLLLFGKWRMLRRVCFVCFLGDPSNDKVVIVTVGMKEEEEEEGGEEEEEVLEITMEWACLTRTRVWVEGDVV